MHSIGSLQDEQSIRCRAVEKGIAELALDTAGPATHLIHLYASSGYRFIEYAQWTCVNYRSVVMSKWITSQSAIRPRL
jgi:hypothetical protein